MTAPVRNTSWPDRYLGHPLVGFPNSEAELRRSQPKGPLFQFLRNLATRDVLSHFDDFDGKTLDTTNYWAVANGGGAAAASFATNIQINGAIRGTTGTANGVTASASLIGPIIFPGNMNPGIEVRFKTVTASTGIRMEVGFIDAVPGANVMGINNMDTPTSNFTNGATVGIDTAATASLFNLVTKGNATSQVIKQTLGTTGLAAAGTWQTIRIQMLSQEEATTDATAVLAWHNGNLIARHDVSTTAGVGAVKGSVLLAPWVYFEAINATSKSLDIDYISTWCDRT